MTGFEDKACKVLGVILFLLIVIMILQLMECTYNGVPGQSIEREYIDDVDINHLT